MNGKDVVNILIPKLLDMGFIVHCYNAKKTSSIYLKLDYGVSCGIRIADHPGKKKYHYRFNVIKDYDGDKVILRDNLVSFFYNYDELDKVLEAVEDERKDKIKRYGKEGYQRYMEIQSHDDLYERFNIMEGVA